MDSQSIKHWSEEYDRHYDEALQEIEESLNGALADQQYITQAQLERVIEWKLAAQPGRRDRNTRLMNGVPDDFVRLVSEAALLLDAPKPN